ncbi:MAG: conserved phage C-terminal domain-containing protein [Candidatus Thiodiazotropha sp. (ex Codakia orbicularis)]|nr:conserved phage C-terminal domain-containing protein [Candidatus Thiodiazotropha sp. (ex Codakia orbicularis)]
MREYGQIQSAYWTHPDIRDLPIETKSIGAYLLTCQHTNGIGCFRMPIGYVSLDLSMGIETVSKGFEELFQKGFLEYDKPSEYVLIPNFLRWNPISNPNSAKARAKEFELIPSSISIYPSVIKALQENGKYWSEDFKEKLETLLKGFRNPIERVSADVRDNKTQPNPYQNKNRTQKDIMSGKPDEVIEYLNHQSGKNFKPIETNLKLVRARIRDGYSVDELKAVVDRKIQEWGDDPQMRQYIRPSTIFGSEKFSQYVGELNQPLPQSRSPGNRQEIIQQQNSAALEGWENEY